MIVHTIRMPDRMNGRELRTIVWDDEAGTVEGDHFDVADLQERLAQEPRVVLGGITGLLALNDPRHDPRDFLALLGHYYWPILDSDRDRPRLPPTLRELLDLRNL